MTGKENAKALVEAKSDTLKVVNDPKLNTSQKIRALHAAGIDRSTIAILLNKRYQHVRNVLITPIKG